MSNLFYRNSGASIAILSAILFGVSPVFTKLIVGEIHPVFLAGILYLGSGLSLFLTTLIRKDDFVSQLKNLSRRKALKLMGAIMSGGIIAPIFLVYGIKYAAAFEVSLLLNLETVATTLIAWLIFKEYIGSRVWLGKIFIILGAGLLVIPWSMGGGANIFRFSFPALSVVAACLFWGIDNNLTREVDELSPSVLAGVKGLAAGTFNICLSLLLGSNAAYPNQMFGALAIGALSYGLSLVLFVQALRLIGASRTSTYFSSGPFFGMLLSIVLLHERPRIGEWIASILMLAGIWVLYREHHEHEHTHESMIHKHPHIHDEHHQHTHEGWEGPEPHDHEHTHEPLTHSHPHLPDIHHRHQH